jgi:hypothetical protein
MNIKMSLSFLGFAAYFVLVHNRKSQDKDAGELKRHDILLHDSDLIAEDLKLSRGTTKFRNGTPG